MKDAMAIVQVTVRTLNNFIFEMKMSFFHPLVGSHTGYNPVGNQMVLQSSGRGRRPYVRMVPGPLTRVEGDRKRQKLSNPGEEKMPKRRRGNRRRKGKKRGIIRKFVPRTLAPKRKLIRCKAVETINLTSASGAIVVRHIQMNSIDDPFVGSGTGQPLGYDQYTALYEFAHVLASKVVVRVFNSGSTSILFGITPVGLNQGTTDLTDCEHYMELPNTRVRLFSPDVDHGIVANKISTKKFLGISKILDTNEYRVNLTDETPPSKLAYWHLWMQSQDHATSGGATVTVTVEYIVLLHDYKIPARSVET